MSGGGTDNLCLRWNDFETNISSAFRDIREQGSVRRDAELRPSPGPGPQADPVRMLALLQDGVQAESSPAPAPLPEGHPVR